MLGTRLSSHIKLKMNVSCLLLKPKNYKNMFIAIPTKPYFSPKFLKSNLVILTHFIHLTFLIKVKVWTTYTNKDNYNKQIFCVLEHFEIQQCYLYSMYKAQK